MMKKVVNYVALLLTLVLVVSCGGKKENAVPANDVLLANKWQVIELSGVSVKEKVNDVVPYLMFDKAEKRYSVITGCNTINGEFSSTDETIKFGLGMSTMMFCEDMSVENGFKEILEKTDSYKIDGDNLTLTGADKSVVAKFKKFTPAE